MRSFRRLYCGTAALQAALLPVLAASVSSHHHGDPHRSLDGVVIDHDHSDHAHGTVLVDQDDDDRTAADGPGIPAATGRRIGPEAPPPLPVTAHRSTTIRPRGRAPPPSRSPRPPPTLS